MPRYPPGLESGVGEVAVAAFLEGDGEGDGGGVAFEGEGFDCGSAAAAYGEVEEAGYFVVRFSCGGGGVSAVEAKLVF